MGFLDSIKKQFIDIIEWTESDDSTLAYRFPIKDNEIQNGATLIVRDSQVALFIDKGIAADHFDPGDYKITTQNLPILTTLRSWKSGFDSPFKSEVYFFSTRQKLGQKWGTPQPIAVRDKEFGSVMLRMFGVLSYRVVDAAVFYKEVSGTREIVRTDDLTGQLVPLIASATAATFAASGVPFLDMAGQQGVLAAELKRNLAPQFTALGLGLESFVIESVSLPPELQKALTERQSMGVVGDVGRYAQYQAAKSIPDAMKNEGGVAGLGAGLAAGVGVGQMVAQAMSGVTAAPGGSAAAATAPCIGCGRGIAAGDTFCKHCGKSQSRACPGCKTEAAKDATFCAKCGTKLAAHREP